MGKSQTPTPRRSTRARTRSPTSCSTRTPSDSAHRGGRNSPAPAPPSPHARPLSGLALLLLTPPHPLLQGCSCRISVSQLPATRLRTHSVGSGRGSSGGNGVVGEGGSCTVSG